jgi:hypothetical protein
LNFVAAVLLFGAKRPSTNIAHPTKKKECARHQVSPRGINNGSGTFYGGR